MNKKGTLLFTALTFVFACFAQSSSFGVKHSGLSSNHTSGKSIAKQTGSSNTHKTGTSGYGVHKSAAGSGAHRSSIFGNHTNVFGNHSNTFGTHKSTFGSHTDKSTNSLKGSKKHHSSMFGSMRSGGF